MFRQAAIIKDQMSTNVQRLAYHIKVKKIKDEKFQILVTIYTHTHTHTKYVMLCVYITNNE